MVNRISTSSRYSQCITDLQKNLMNFNKLSNQISSGNKFSSITEDPIASVNILNTNRQIEQIDIFQQNVELGKSELSTLDDLLEVSRGYLQSAWDKATQANNQTYGKDSLQAIKIEIDETLKTIVDLANTEFNDNFIFGGANTKTSPYEITDNGDIVYNGTPYSNPDYIRQTEVADGVFEVINTTGDKVFGYYKAQDQDAKGNNLFLDQNGNIVTQVIDRQTGTTKYYNADNSEYTGDVNDLEVKEGAYGIIGTLKLLSKSLEQVVNADTPEAEKEGYELMHSTLDMFSNSLDMILNEQTKFGGIYNRLEMSSTTLETNNTNLTAYLSDLKDTDLTTAITEWMQAQYAYQASMQVSASSMGMSLLNYL